MAQVTASLQAADSPEGPEITYRPTDYSGLGYRVSTPPCDWGEAPSPPAQKGDTTAPAAEPKVSEASSKDSTVDPALAMRRRQFAIRRESTIGAMVMTEKWEDTEIRRRFRNYEI